MLHLLIVGRLRRSFPGLAHATSPAVVIGYTSVVGISSPARWCPGGLIVWQIAGWQCRRRNAPIIGGSLVVGREGLQNLGNPSTEAYGAAAYPGCMVSLERLLQRLAEHLVVADGR